MSNGSLTIMAPEILSCKLSPDHGNQDGSTMVFQEQSGFDAETDYEKTGGQITCLDQGR